MDRFSSGSLLAVWRSRRANMPPGVLGTESPTAGMPPGEPTGGQQGSETSTESFNDRFRTRRTDTDKGPQGGPFQPTIWIVPNEKL